jgi:RimJ/RimL family protein N-acetyltransferase
LTGPVIALRRLRQSDSNRLRVLFGDADTLLWNPGPSPESLDRWLLEMSEPADDHRTWAVAESDDFVGVVSIFTIDRLARSAEIGFRTLPVARGRGISRTAVALAITEVAREHIIDELVLFHAVDNVGSCRVATASGFELVETLPDNWTYGDGRAHDEHRHRLAFAPQTNGR